MLSQILCVDNGRLVNEVILGFLVTMDSVEERKVLQIQVVECMVEAMHTQLMNMGALEHFRYQRYLVHLLFHYNQEHFS